MSIKNNIEFVDRQIQILDKLITIRVSDDNLFEQFFDPSKLESEWHRQQVGEYHFSQLIGCLRKYYWNFQTDIDNDIKTKGVFYIGKMIHKEIQQTLEERYGFAIIERPLLDECGDFNIIGKVDIIDTLKHRETDIKTQSYLPTLVNYDKDKFEERYGKYILQTLAYAYFLNNTYFSIDNIKTIRVLLVDKKTLECRVIELDYDHELGEFFYLKLRERAKVLHKCLLLDKVPEQFHLEKNCKYCLFAEEQFCPEGAELKDSLIVPETYETREYKKKYGKNKKPYWKYDEDEKRWIKSKGFVKFLKEELNYNKERMEELP